MFDYQSAFSRNIGWVTEAEQSLLKTKKVAIAGMGGVGAEHLVTLLRLGLTRFSISDFDEYEVHNFNRQAGAYMSTVGKPKCEVMADVARDINPDCELTTFDEGINENNVDEFLENVDIYVDSLDFFALDARKLLFGKCEEKGIPVVTAAPLGMGTALLCFLPGRMSYEEYFRFNDAQTEEEQYIKFLIGLSPAMLQRSYLVDPTKADFKARKGPSTIMAVKLCAGAAATFTLKILLNRGNVPAAPHGLHFDAYTNKLRKTWRPDGNRSPIQKIAFKIAKKIVLKDKPPVVEDPLPEAPIEQVLHIARWAPSGDNTQVWRFEVLDDKRCIVHGTDTSDWVVYDLQGNASKLALGCLIENIDLAASALGFTADISFKKEDSSPASDGEPGHYLFEVSLKEAHEQTQSTFDQKLYNYIPIRTVQRKPMGTAPLTPREKASLEESLPPGFSVIWKESKEERLAMAKLLYGNGKTRLSMKEGFNVHSNIIEFMPRSEDDSTNQNENNEISQSKLPAKSLGVDPLTVALTKWSLKSWPRLEFMGKYLGGTVVPRFLMDFVPAVKSSALFAIVADKETVTDEDYFTAGRAVQRFWLQSAVLNLGFQPCQTPVIFSEYQRRGVKFTDNTDTIKNAQKMEARFQQIFGSESTSKIVFMGRLGRTEVPKYRSVRLPLSELKITK